MRLLHVLATVAVGFTPASLEAIPAVGVFADAQATSCNIQQEESGPGTFYLLCILGGPVADGILSAEFRVDGFPTTWFPNVVANPAAQFTLGNPLYGGGTILFPCQRGDNGVVHLYTIEYFATPPRIENRYLEVFKTTIRMDPRFQCPLLTLCVGPPLVKVCATGVSGIINGPPCTVAVAPTSWTGLKKLYE
jgi:hypothetical protein